MTNLSDYVLFYMEYERNIAAGNIGKYVIGGT